MTKYTLDSSREWYNNLPGKRASAAVLIRHEGKYLMTKDDYKDAMTFPGGVVDPDEGPKQAAIREVWEEVGIALDSDKVHYLSVLYINKVYGFNDRFQFYFMTEIDRNMVDALRFEKSIEYHKWADVSEIGILAGNRLAYTRLADMIQAGDVMPYFEV